MTQQEIMAYRPQEGYGLIYKFTHPNGKGFIGKTVRPIQECAGYKGRHYESEPAFYPALRKFGFEAFEAEILEEVPVKFLTKSLQEWISKYNTLTPFGYNVKPGYKGPHISAIMKKRVCMYDLKGNLLKTYETMMEAANDLNIKHKYIYRCAMHRRESVQGHTFRYFLDVSRLFNHYPDPYAAIPVAKLDKMGYVTEVYNSSHEASLANNLDENAILEACNNDREIKAKNRIYSAGELNTGWEFCE